MEEEKLEADSCKDYDKLKSQLCVHGGIAVSKVLEQLTLVKPPTFFLKFTLNKFSLLAQCFALWILCEKCTFQGQSPDHKLKYLQC